ncbi:MAG: fibronectin type III domain-containing protein [Myxococcota bacterium]
MGEASLDAVAAHETTGAEVADSGPAEVRLDALPDLGSVEDNETVEGDLGGPDLPRREVGDGSDVGGDLDVSEVKGLDLDDDGPADVDGNDLGPDADAGPGADSPSEDDDAAVDFDASGDGDSADAGDGGAGDGEAGDDDADGDGDVDAADSASSGDAGAGDADSETDAADAEGPLDEVAPSFAGVFSAEAVSATEVRLTWEAATDDVSPGSAIVYEVCVSEKRVAVGGCQPFTVDDESAPGVVVHIVSGLEPNTRYFFVVHARDAAGNSDANLVWATALTPGDQAIRAVAVGGAHACAVMARGTVRCWGENSWGQLGDGTKVLREVAAPVLGLERVRAVAAGFEHTCALMGDGTVRCWGRNDRGQLGDGTTASSEWPVEVAGLSMVKALAGSGGHTCAILGAGTMRCWGANDDGQLGDGTFEDRLEPAEVVGAAYVKDVACGAEHTCAVAADGLVACWGRGDAGRLGHGDESDRTVWTTVEALEYVTDVTAGEGHSCARLGDGTVWCWGANDQGQSGAAATSAAELLPVEVAGIERASDVAAGGDRACARIGDGSVRCWGAGASSVALVPSTAAIAALGVGAQQGCARTGEGRAVCWAFEPSSGVPSPAVAVQGLVDLAAPVDVTAGNSFVCPLLSDGTMRCWGANEAFQLGATSVPGQVLPPPEAVPIQVLDVHSASGAGAMNDHACAMLASGGVKCWGADGYGGNLGAGNATIPQGASGFAPLGVLGLTHALSVGHGELPTAQGTCAARADGQLFCWGIMIIPFIEESAWSGFAIAIGGGVNVIMASSARRFLAADGLVRKWASPNPSDSSEEAGVDRVIALSGRANATALRGDGTVWFWDSFVRIKPSNWEFIISAPTWLGGFADVIDVASVGSHLVLGARADGRVQGWGAGGNTLTLGVANPGINTWPGNETPKDFNKIVDIEPIEDAIAVACHTGLGCALIADGRLRCWGLHPNEDGTYTPTHIPWDVPFVP